MARFNEIQVGRFNRFFQKLMALKGGPPVPTLAPEISPSLPILSGVENRYLEGWDRFASSENVLAVALNFGRTQLRNPTGSNLVCVVERLTICNPLGVGAASEIQFGQPGSNFPTVDPSRSVETRGRVGSTCITSQTTTAGGGQIGTTIHRAFLPAAGASSIYDFIIDDFQELALFPNDSLSAQLDVANNQFFVSWLWRERFLEDSERT